MVEESLVVVRRLKRDDLVRDERVELRQISGKLFG
jgi:hypothetical protein